MKANTMQGEMTYNNESCKMYYQVEKYIRNLDLALTPKSLPINIQGHQIGLKKENIFLEIIGKLRKRGQESPHFSMGMN